MSNFSDPLSAYAAVFKDLTADSLPRLAALLTDDVFFRDPFHALNGRDAVVALFRGMYKRMPEARFEVLDVCAHPDGETHYLRWRFTGGRFDFTGVSTVRFNAAGLVSEHIDYWDAAGGVYERLPVLGGLLRGFRRLAFGAQ
jgi:steroid delta-isomerase